MAFQDVPMKVDLEKGEIYSFCACGKSKKAPFCDGSHKGTQHEPHVVYSEEGKNMAFCACFRSKNRPFCDGTHRECKKS